MDVIINFQYVQDLFVNVFVDHLFKALRAVKIIQHLAGKSNFKEFSFLIRLYIFFQLYIASYVRVKYREGEYVLCHKKPPKTSNVRGRI